MSQLKLESMTLHSQAAEHRIGSRHIDIFSNLVVLFFFFFFCFCFFLIICLLELTLTLFLFNNLVSGAGAPVTGYAL